MTMRQRKLAGAVLLLMLVPVYALAAMFAAITLQVHDSKLVELIFYIVAGLAWVLPAAAIVTWMQRPDRKETAPSHRD